MPRSLIFSNHLAALVHPTVTIAERDAFSNKVVSLTVLILVVRVDSQLHALGEIHDIAKRIYCGVALRQQHLVEAQHFVEIDIDTCIKGPYVRVYRSSGV